MKLALVFFLTLFSTTFADALPLELHDWYTPKHAPPAANIETTNIHEQMMRLDIKRTEKHRELDRLDSNQLFEESLFFDVPHAEV